MMIRTCRREPTVFSLRAVLPSLEGHPTTDLSVPSYRRTWSTRWTGARSSNLPSRSCSNEAKHAWQTPTESVYADLHLDKVE